MLLQIHPALRALVLAFGSLLVLILGSLAAYSGLKSLALSGVSVPPPPTASAPSASRNYIADPAAASRRIPVLVKQSHGDWNRLSDADQRMLNGMTAGHGRDMLQALAKKQAATARRHLQK